MIDAYIDQPISPWEWIRSVLLPILPVRMVAGGGGVRPVVTPSAPSRATAFHIDLDSGGEAEIVGGIRVAGGPPISEWSLRYAVDARSGRATRSAVLAPRASTPYAARAATRWGRGQGARDVTTPAVCDDRTAHLILADWAAASWSQRRARVVASDVPPWRDLQPGDVATVSRAALGLDHHLAVVEEVTPDPEAGTIVLELRILS